MEWPRNPCLEVACPACHAKVGAWCKRPSGHKAADIHVEREQFALDESKLQRCAAAPHGSEQMALFDARAARSFDRKGDSHVNE
jgi:hypothetical protein